MTNKCHEATTSIKVVNISKVSLCHFLISFSTSPSPPTTTNLLSVPIDEFAFSRLFYKGKHTICTFFFIWLLSLSIIESPGLLLIVEQCVLCG